MKRDEPFNEQLRRAVGQAGMTHAEISRRTGIAQSILSRFVNHGAGLSIDSIDKLCRCLRLHLVGEDQPPQPNKDR